jgi:two-component system, LuxR family, sensor kinase FixL
MSWITIIWSMVASACLTLAFIHFYIWVRDTRRYAYFLFSLAALGAALTGIFELFTLQAQSVSQYDWAMYWGQIPEALFVIVIGWFIRVYFHVGHRWILITIAALWTVLLVVNFSSPHTIEFREITGFYKEITFLGERFAQATGEPNPWRYLGDAASALMVLFVADVSVALCRKGSWSSGIMTGGIAILISLCTIQNPLADAGLLHTPYMVSLWFLVIVVAMSHQLGADVLRAAQLARKLQASQASLRESETRFCALADNAPVMIWMSGTDMLCNFFNKQWLEFTGRTMEQESGNGWQEGVHIEDLQYCRDIYYSRFKARHPFSMEYRLRRANGEYRWILDHGIPRYMPQGEFAGYIGSCIDITERKEAELQLYQQRDELAHLSRVTTLGEMATAIAHELNQPLGAIHSNAEAAEILLQKDRPDLDELRAILSDIRQDGWRAREVVHRMGSLLKRRRFKMEQIEVKELVENLRGLIQAIILSRNARLQTEIAPALPPIWGDAVQLQQVLLNLILNAVDAMIDNPIGEREVVVRAGTSSGSGVEISVTDQGHGFSKEKLAKFFEPFFTTKKDGMGMGLRICQTIVEWHGGLLVAENNPGGGATVRVTLPGTRNKEAKSA